MTKYGYVAYTFRVHKVRGEPLELGAFDGNRDAIVVLYGVLRGLGQTPHTDGNRHLRANWVTGQGRTIAFSVDIGHSGHSSQFFDPEEADDEPVFERTHRHIESTTRRGLIVAPCRSTVGLLITEVQGRSGVRTLLDPALSRAFRHHTGHVLDIAAVVDESALRQYLEQANVREILLRRTGMPTDVADAVNFSPEEAEAGRLELRIKPASQIREVRRRIVDRLRGDHDARRQLLQVHGLDFDDVSVAMEVGERKTTLTITADRIPSFVYELPGRSALTDQDFLAEVRATVPEMARAVGVTVVEGWQAGDWSAEALEVVLAMPQEGASDELEMGGW